MGGYFGTELQQRLQRCADEFCAADVDTPGLCSAGRMVSADDVDRVGLDHCVAMIDRAGVFGFRLVPTRRAAEISEALTARGYRVDWWDTFRGGRDAVEPVVRPIAAGGPPAGLRQIDLGDEASDAELERVQAFLAAQGIAPFSCSTLASRTVRGCGFALVDRAGEVVATSFAYLPHNNASPYRDHAWVGLIGVAPAHRGRRLGIRMNACAAEAAFARLGAAAVYEQAAATNLPSRRMIEACGLALDPGLKSGIASTGTDTFTR